MRIGLYLDIAPHGGGQFQYALSMLEALTKIEQDEVIQIVAISTHSEWQSRFSDLPIAFHYWPVSHLRRAVHHAWRKIGLPVWLWRNFAARVDSHVRKLVGLDCDLWVFPAQDAMAYMLPCRALTTVHDLMHRYEAHFPEVAGGRIRDYHYQATAEYAASILVDSHTGADQLSECYMPQGRVEVVPYVAPSYVRSESDVSLDVSVRIPTNYLFYPAQFWKHKNHERLVEALKMAKQRGSDANIVFCGARKNGYQDLVEKIVMHGLENNITVLDYVSDEDLVGLYRRSRGLIMPTFFGPTNIPPLEAMALGCPSAVSDIYGMREQCGDAAIYFNPLSVDGICDAIIDLWGNSSLRSRLIDAGFRRNANNTQARFSRDVHGALLNVLREKE